MRVKILLQITTDDGAPDDVEEVASLDKSVERAEDIGLSLAESKALLAAAQQRIVEAQTKNGLRDDGAARLAAAEDEARAATRSYFTRCSAMCGWRVRRFRRCHAEKRKEARPCRRSWTSFPITSRRSGLSGDALGLARSLRNRGRTPGRYPAGHRWRQRHDGASARPAGRRARRSGPAKRQGLLRRGKSIGWRRYQSRTAASW